MIGENISVELQKAREYEKREAGKIEKDSRPKFHLTPMTGWCNDPNGFCFYKGQYHLFYQYHPYDSFWGPMHWGHAVSNDLVNWEYLCCAIAPDMPYDNKGCFSGSSIELKDGRHLLMYTGVHEEVQSDGSIRDIQEQCIAVGDGVNYTKYEQNPVIRACDLPEGCSKFDFRDPKIFSYEDGTYGAVIVSCDSKSDGRVLLYKSDDGFNWKFDHIIDVNNSRFGKIWECPDFFTLDGKDVLMISPCDMKAFNLEYHNGHGTVFMTGKNSPSGFKIESDRSLDYGLDFYAPATIAGPDGKRILVGWMGNWATCRNHDSKQKYFGQMTIPRELKIKDGDLYQMPVKEIDSRRKNLHRYTNIVFEDIKVLDGVKGRFVDLDVCFDFEEQIKGRIKEQKNAGAVCGLKIACGNGCYSTLCWRPDERTFEIDRSHDGSRIDQLSARKCYLGDEQKSKIVLRIIIDLNCVEVFINGGKQVMSFCIDSAADADGIEFFSRGSVTLSVEKYELA